MPASSQGSGRWRETPSTSLASASIVDDTHCADRYARLLGDIADDRYKCAQFVVGEGDKPWIGDFDAVAIG